MKKLVLPIFLSILLVGCNDEKTLEVNNANGEEVKEVAAIIKNEDEINSGRAIFVEDQLLVAIQAKPWLDYKKTKIEKNLKKKLEEILPEYDITVSSDYKLYWEAQKLLKEEDSEKVKEKLEKLKKLKKEET
ncbi:YhcN/YlaJ family sporulation lipoprotein [Ureibacillus thermosphaericus]|uniref:YhcN/YlaJ family sporulation lipoprotein n=1 Tax=Ureibacillus thermosphaericus TaxID=51173 RepID=UPI000BBC4DB1|nr:YhcN/YlaJ family sporulation lipoprotein [Ureibacillus thermosphaericus]